MWNFFIKNSRFSLILLAAVIISGIVSLITLPRESSPEINVPYASITTIYPGASPSDIERDVTDPIETAISGMDDIISVSSSSSMDYSSVFIEFSTTVDIDEQVVLLRQEVAGIESSLPDGIQDPMVNAFNINEQPVLILTLSSDTLSDEELQDTIAKVQEDLEGFKDVESIDVSGVVEKEIQIALRPQAMEKHGISMTEVMGIIQAANITMPLGTVEYGEQDYSLRLESNLAYEDLENLTIRSATAPGDKEIQLRHIANIDITDIETNQIARASYQGSEPDRALVLSVTHQAGGDIVKLVDAIDTYLMEQADGGPLEHVQIFTTQNDAEYIQEQLVDLSISGLETVGLILIVLLFVLGLREAFIASLSIPLSFLITFTGLSLLGNSFNFLSLFSLVLALGILVDTSIVITEGMHNRLERGDTPKQAAMRTIEEYKWPLIAGTLTTVAAFAPMLLMTGIIGEYVKHIPQTVVLTLLASLFVGLGLLPVIGAGLLKPSKKEKKKSIFKRAVASLKKRYATSLEWVLAKKKRMRILFAVTTVAFLASLALPVSGLLGVSMFPASEYPLFFVNVELEKGMLIDATQEVVEEVEEALIEVEEIESFVVKFNRDGNAASFTVNIAEDRDRTTFEIQDELAEMFDVISEETGTDVALVALSDGPPEASDVEFRIIGEDFDVLAEEADNALVALGNIEGVRNAQSSLDDAATEFVLEIDREIAFAYGTDPSTIAQLARLAVSGLTVTSYVVDGEELDVVLYVKGDVLETPIATYAGTFPLSTFTHDITNTEAPAAISRLDGERVVTITADVDEDVVVADVLAELDETFNDESLADGYRLDVGGATEEMMESFASLGRALILGILLIVIILLLQFNSFKQMFVILTTIPMALIGVFAGLSLLGLEFSFTAFVGIIALAGIVVNNAIILLDRANKNHKEGKNRGDAMQSAAVSRFQPIVLTSLTTIIGILPLTLSDETWGPMGSAIISGLLVSTFLTLFVVPAMYKRFVK